MEKKINNSVKQIIVNFEQKPVRRVWDEKKFKWFFSVVDIIAILAQNDRPRKYWDDLKRKLKDEGSEVSEKIGQLKMTAPDGKKRLTDVADTETLFRVIQSIPSPKAEPFKLWLAKVGYERLQETADPELAVIRARSHWKQIGHSEKWIEQRMRGQEIRNKLTDYWAGHEISEQEEFAKLTNIIHKEWSGVTVGQHKTIKGLKRHNLRDNMTEAELVFTALAELSTTQIAKSDEAEGYIQNAQSAKKGGRISRNARIALERQTGKKVVSSENFLPAKEEPKKLYGEESK